MLAPQEKWTEAKTFIDNTPGLDDETKAIYAKYLKNYERKMEMLKSEAIEAAANESKNKKEKELEPNDHKTKSFSKLHVSKVFYKVSMNCI